MTQRLHGVPAAPGAALASIWRYAPAPAESSPGPDRHDLDAAAVMAAAQLDELARGLAESGRPQEAQILEAQALMARDETLIEEARRRMAGGEDLAAALLGAAEAVAATLEELEDAVLSARAADVRDVGARIVRIGRGIEAPTLAGRSIAIADDLPPSVTAELDRSLLVGIALQAGSRTAHAAILARALGIPAVVGVTDLLSSAAEAAQIGIDGDTGEVWVDPDDMARGEIQQRMQAWRDRAAADRGVRAEVLATRDGHRLLLGANIGRPEDAGPAAEAGAETIGLFRTEFMFMGRQGAPDEETQAAAYRQVFEAFGRRPVVIRLLDLGGDKDIPYLDLPHEANPFLGVRALRIGRLQPELILTQLRAICRAGAQTTATIQVMAPMVGDLSDVELYHELAGRARLELDAAGIARAPRVALGIMIEVPSAVVLADQLAATVDFFSVGTNDLTQYLLAADRTNPALAAWQDPMHPAVLRALRDIVAAAKRPGIPVAVCGEMAGDPSAAVVLAGLGIDELSMEAASFGAVKRAVRSVSLDEARKIATACLAAPSAAAARHMAEAPLSSNGNARDPAEDPDSLG